MAIFQTVAEAELKEEIDAQADIRKEVETLQIDYDSLVKDTKVRSRVHAPTPIRHLNCFPLAGS